MDFQKAKRHDCDSGPLDKREKTQFLDLDWCELSTTCPDVSEKAPNEFASRTTRKNRHVQRGRQYICARAKAFKILDLKPNVTNIL